jgi:hypothetical protein
MAHLTRSLTPKSDVFSVDAEPLLICQQIRDYSTFESELRDTAPVAACIRPGSLAHVDAINDQRGPICHSL